MSKDARSKKEAGEFTTFLGSFNQDLRTQGSLPKVNILPLLLGKSRHSLHRVFSFSALWAYVRLLKVWLCSSLALLP